MEEKSPEWMARCCADSVNAFTFDEERFCHAMANQHRTLQQSFTKVALRWLYHLAEQQQFDGRNEASVEAGKKVAEALGPCGWALPLV